MQNTILPLAYVVLHTVVIYLFLTLMLHLVGRRTMGQLTMVDLVIIIVLGSAVETSMVSGNTTLPAGLVCVLTLLATNRLFTLLALRSRRFRHFVQGSPVLLVHFGQFIEEHMRRVGLTHADVLQAVHERGEAGIETVKFAVLEVDGEINVVPMDAPHEQTAPVIQRRPACPPTM